MLFKFQERFLLFKPDPSEKLEKVLWWVPITYTTSQLLNFQSTHPSHWMKKEEQIKISDLPSENDWIILNIQETGNIYF